MQQEMHLRNKSVWLQLIVLSVLEGSRHCRVHLILIKL